jgi:hypothetical protein
MHDADDPEIIHPTFIETIANAWISIQFAMPYEPK